MGNNDGMFLMKSFRKVAFGLLTLGSVLILGSCGGGGGDGGGAAVLVPAPPPSFAVNVTVSGLNGSGLTLQNNAGDNLDIGANGTATFATQLLSGANYAAGSAGPALHGCQRQWNYRQRQRRQYHSGMPQRRAFGLCG